MCGLWNPTHILKPPTSGKLQYSHHFPIRIPAHLQVLTRRSSASAAKSAAETALCCACRLAQAASAWDEEQGG